MTLIILEQKLPNSQDKDTIIISTLSSHIDLDQDIKTRHPHKYRRREELVLGKSKRSDKLPQFDHRCIKPSQIVRRHRRQINRPLPRRHWLIRWYLNLKDVLFHVLLVLFLILIALIDIYRYIKRRVRRSARRLEFLYKPIIDKLVQLGLLNQRVVQAGGWDDDDYDHPYLQPDYDSDSD